MKIDIERLKTDAAYLDGVQNGLFHFTEMKTKRCFGIPRPTKPAAPDWGKDLPDIGAEKQYYNSEMNEVRECVVIAHRHGCAVVEDQDGQTYEAVPPDNFIRTKEQRKRDELAGLIDDAQMLLGSFWTRQKAAEIILSRYNLEPKDD